MAEQATVGDVATWMASEFTTQGKLAQSHAAAEIRKRFGEEFVYKNSNGNAAISPAVLKEFRRLTEGTAIWERSGFYWRTRRDSDDSNRRGTNY